MGQTAKQPRSAIQRYLWLAVGIAISLAFVWLIVKESRFDAFAGSFARLSFPFLLAALGVLALGQAFRIVRWWWMLRALVPDLRLSRCIGPFLAGVAVNNVVPFRAGDALRVVGFRDQLGAPPMRVFGTVVVERILDVTVLLGVAVICLAGLSSRAVLPAALANGVAWLFALCIGGAVVLVWLAPRLVQLRHVSPGGRFARLAEARWWPVVAAQLGHLGDALVITRYFPRALVLVGLSILGWVCEGVMFVVVAAAFGADYLSGAPWLSLASGTLATLIPSSPGYVGTFDYFAAQGFAAYGSTMSQAVAFAVTVHALIWIGLTLAGAPFAVLRALALRRTPSKGNRPTGLD
ncbi:MAG: flippase-like domain-containing protein [Gammaproteobacteria bacterium]|nr:flippase-like domain-containing protein [Gammaproteobacteria bacterium]MYF29505.1 flippase-like domain-containing protein [Gammaproteobacteria bacterium]MYK46944.1 flippase-like domain-containing protein [Gammaproteobacteria bacterium]